MPPFNGFTSKWLIVAGCILAGMRFPLFLVLGLVALFISLVTLASFLKVLGAVFLGKADESLTNQEKCRRPWLCRRWCWPLSASCLGCFPQRGVAFHRAGGGRAHRHPRLGSGREQLVGWRRR